MKNTCHEIWCKNWPHEVKVNKIEEYQNSVGLFNIKYLIDYTAVPDRPTNLEASDVFSDRATLTWKAPANDGGAPITGYYLERCTNNSGRWIRATRDLVKLTTYEAEGLMDGTKYEWRAVAVNSRGESKPSEPCEFVAKDPWGKIIHILPTDIHVIKTNLGM